MARPSSLPRWAETVAGVPAANITEPNESKKDVGLTLGGDVPTSGGFNWWMRLVYSWLLHFAQEAVSWPAKHTFSAGLASSVAPTAASDVARLAEVHAEAAARASAVSAEATARSSGDASTLTSAENYADARDIQLVTAPQYLTLATGWTAAAGAEPMWWSDRSGVIHLNGKALAGATATMLIATLPVAARPGTDQWVQGTSNAGAGLVPVGVVVGAVGDITTPLVVGDTVALDGISFYPGY